MDIYMPMSTTVRHNKICDIWQFKKYKIKERSEKNVRA
jgi:hypothetical protein